MTKWFYRLSIWWSDRQIAKEWERTDRIKSQTDDHKLEVALLHSNIKHARREAEHAEQKLEKAEADIQFYTTLIHGGVTEDEEVK